MFLELPALLSPASFQGELAQLEAMCRASGCTDLILAGDGSVAQVAGSNEPDTSSWVVSPEFKSAVESAIDRWLMDAIVHWDLLWLRAKGRAAGTPTHCDRTYLEKHTTLCGQPDRQVATLWCLMRDIAPGQSQLMMHGRGKTGTRVQARAAGDAVLFDADQQHSATAGRSGKLRFSFDVRVTFASPRA
jgi:hypothetical protein